MYGEDIIEKLINKKRLELLRKSEGFVEHAQYIELELIYDETWMPEPFILTASKDHCTVTAQGYAVEAEAEADYQSLKNKYRLKVSTPQK